MGPVRADGIRRAALAPFLALSLAGCAASPPAAPGGDFPGPRGFQHEAPLAWPSGSWEPVPLAGTDAASGAGEAAADGNMRSVWAPRTPPASGGSQDLTLRLAAPLTGLAALQWDAHPLHYVTYGEGRPVNYRLEASASASGEDFALVHEVRGNAARSRIVLVQAAGWLRLRWRFTGAAGPALREVRVFRAADGRTPGECWILLGDSVTSVALDLEAPDALTGARRARTGRGALWVGAGTGGDATLEIAPRLDATMAGWPAGSLVGLCYGANDATRGVSAADYAARLKGACRRLLAAGHRPVLAPPPPTLNPLLGEYAEACREIARELPGVTAGPDLASIFEASPESYRTDRVHPNEAGIRRFQEAWGAL